MSVMADIADMPTDVPLDEKLQRIANRETEDFAASVAEVLSDENIKRFADKLEENYDLSDPKMLRATIEASVRVSKAMEILAWYISGFDYGQLEHILQCDNCGGMQGLLRMMFVSHRTEHFRSVQYSQFLLELWNPAVKGINRPARDENGLVIPPENEPASVHADLMEALGL